MSNPVPLSVPTGKIRLTYEDYLSLPDDGNRYEILEGELVMTPVPSTRHQRISRQIQHRFILAMEDSGKGEIFSAPLDVVFDDESIVQPDLVYIAEENLGIIGEKNIQGAPDLIIEILSPSTRHRDVLTKSKALCAQGRTGLLDRGSGSGPHRNRSPRDRRLPIHGSFLGAPGHGPIGSCRG